jgi:carbon-monoxide dehydrogenase small subunit
MTKTMINGQSCVIEAPPMTRLLDVLRRDLGLTGSKEGCGEGECGSCTVLVDGEAWLSCLVPVCQVAGRNVTTIEGLESTEGHLNRLQETFVSEGGAQCGICTPGFIVAAKALLDQSPNPTRAEVREALAGNLCRCTGYTKIVDAVMEASRDR